MPRKLLPHEWFHSYRPRQGQDGQWNVWEHNGGMPNIVAKFSTEELARNHAIHLNALAREGWEVKAEDPLPSALLLDRYPVKIADPLPQPLPLPCPPLLARYPDTIVSKNFYLLWVIVMIILGVSKLSKQSVSTENDGRKFVQSNSWERANNQAQPKREYKNICTASSVTQKIPYADQVTIFSECLRRDRNSNFVAKFDAAVPSFNHCWPHMNIEALLSPPEQVW